MWQYHQNLCPRSFWVQDNGNCSTETLNDTFHMVSWQFVSGGIPRFSKGVNFVWTLAKLGLKERCFLILTQESRYASWLSSSFPFWVLHDPFILTVLRKIFILKKTFQRMLLLSPIRFCNRTLLSILFLFSSVQPVRPW